MLMPLVVVLVLHAAEPNEAEQLFRQMEKQVAGAKTLEWTFDIKMEGGPGGALNGSLTFSEGNKSRLEMNANLTGKKSKDVMICDGLKMAVLTDGVPKKTSDAPKHLNEVFGAALSRSGLLLPYFTAYVPDKDKEFKIDEQFPVSNFKLGKKEKVGEQEAQVIQYTLSSGAIKFPLAITVWLDAKTNLPLKRIIVTMKGDEKLTVTETYSKLSLDPKIDPKNFELPKD